MKPRKNQAHNTEQISHVHRQEWGEKKWDKGVQKYTLPS